MSVLCKRLVNVKPGDRKRTKIAIHAVLFEGVRWMAKVTRIALLSRHLQDGHIHLHCLRLPLSLVGNFDIRCGTTAAYRFGRVLPAWFGLFQQAIAADSQQYAVHDLCFSSALVSAGLWFAGI